MSGNKIGKMFNVTTFGSSHGTALGAVVDGCPAGLKLSDNDIQIELDKRKPGTSQITTSRGEKDEVKVLSGLFKGKTDGTPIAALVYNQDMDSSAYENLKKPQDQVMGITHGKLVTGSMITGEGDVAVAGQPLVMLLEEQLQRNSLKP